MAYENTAGLPFTGNLPYKGTGAVNGEPINRSNAGYKTMGGIIASSDSNNTGLIATFGLVVSSLPANDGSSFVIGCPAGYVARGIIVADNGVLGNEPAKATYVFQDIPVTVGYDGTYRFTGFSNTQTGSSLTPDFSYQPIFRATSAGTGAAPIGTIEFIPGSSAVPTGWQALPGYIVEDPANVGLALEVSFDSSILSENSLLLPYGTPFRVTGTLTSAAAATPVVLLTDAQVGVGRKVYITNFIENVNGATVWATTANVFVQDTAAVAAITTAVAGLTANATLTIGTANVTLATTVSQGAGLAAGKGIAIAGNANGTGSNLIVTVSGFIL